MQPNVWHQPNVSARVATNVYLLSVHMSHENTIKTVNDVNEELHQQHYHARH